MQKLSVSRYLVSALILVVMACSSDGGVPPPTEEQLIERFKVSVAAFVVRDWDAFRSTCASESSSKSDEQLATEHQAVIGPSWQPEDITFKDFEVLPLEEPDVRLRMTVLFNGVSVGTDRLTWTIQNGEWVNKNCLGAHG